MKLKVPGMYIGKVEEVAMHNDYIRKQNSAKGAGNDQHVGPGLARRKLEKPKMDKRKETM